MNQAVRDYVASVIEREKDRIRGARVLEIGSYNVNGTVRDLFEAAGCASYTGLDKREGPNVDEVMDIHDTDEFQFGVDVMVCCEMLEHDRDFNDTAAFILELGPRLLIATTRGIGYGLHDEPEDYWRFTEHGLRLWFRRAGFEPAEIIDHAESKGVFGYGIR